MRRMRAFRKIVCPLPRIAAARGCRLGMGGSPVRLVYAVKRGFDYLGGSACDALLDAIYGEYERKAGDFLGSAIVGSVQDEMPSIPTWTRDFEAKFHAETGYSLLDHLPCLWEGNDVQARKVRHDFQATRARLAEEAFFRKAFEWHEKHGLQCGCDPKTHARKGNPLGCVETYAALHRTNRWYAAPGCDHHGNGRVHASLAWLNKRPRVWLEAFYASGWSGTLEDTWLVAPGCLSTVRPSAGRAASIPTSSACAANGMRWKIHQKAATSLKSASITRARFRR